MMFVDGWVKHIFTYKFRYSETLQCLCFVLSKTNVEEINNWFDNFSYFQNSTDQDYNYEYWNGIPYFEEQVKKVKSLNTDDFKELYIKNSPYWDDCDEEYFEDDDYTRKSLVYTLCYEEVEYLWGDRMTLCLLPEFKDLYDYREYVRKIMLEYDKKYETTAYHELFNATLED